jgi:hypothetical protein
LEARIGIERGRVMPPTLAQANDENGVLGHSVRAQAVRTAKALSFSASVM